MLSQGQILKYRIKERDRHFPIGILQVVFCDGGKAAEGSYSTLHRDSVINFKEFRKGKYQIYTNGISNTRMDFQHVLAVEHSLSSTSRVISKVVNSRKFSKIYVTTDTYIFATKAVWEEANVSPCFG